jgi:hypothetical protein
MRSNWFTRGIHQQRALSHQRKLAVADQPRVSSVEGRISTTTGHIMCY